MTNKIPALSSVLSEIRAAFGQISHPASAAPMEAYMKGIAPYLGISAPRRRLAQKELFAEYKELPFAELLTIINALFNEPERELHYLGMDWLYSRRKEFTAKTITIIGHMITTKSWWDTVDFLATRCLGSWAATFPKEARPVIYRYIKSMDMWLNRSAILHQLHYGSDTDTALLTDAILPHIASKEFFLRKATGWALRNYARTNPDWVREFVDTYPLSGLSRREAMKHL